MSPADAVWYLGESPANPMMISSIVWFDRTPDLDRLRAVLMERLIARHPVFRERITPSRWPLLLPTWQEHPTFDLDQHLEVSRLPAPGDHATLQRVCGEQRSQPLDRTRPLWKVDVLTGYRGGGCAMHASTTASANGLALLSLLLGLADEFDPGLVPVVDAPVPESPTHSLPTRTAHPARPGRPAALLDKLLQVAVSIAWGFKLLAPAMVERTGLIGRPSGTKRMALDPDGLPLDAVRGMAHEAGATVNDVLLALLTGALHRYLSERDDLVDDVLVMVPVNLRSPGEPLPRHLGNRIGRLPVLLPVRLPTAEARLTAVHERLDALKRSPAPAVSRVLLAGTALLAPPMERGIHRLNQLRSTGVVINVPGPQAPMHLAGARILGVIGWGGMTGHLNLGGAFMSLGGRVFSGIVTDEAITPDPDRILTHLRDEWANLRGRVAA